MMNKKIDPYLENHKSYIYAKEVVKGEINAPKYVKKQCKIFIKMAENIDEKYVINIKKLKKIDKLLKLMIMPKGKMAGKKIYDCLVGFQFLFIVSILCAVHKEDKSKRRYTRAILEICRKNGKTFLIAVTFILLFLLEPKFSKFYSVAPDGSLSRLIKEEIEEILASSPVLQPEQARRFKIRRDDILCKINTNKYVPLNYSNSRLDGKLPNVYLIDEAGALPNAYALEAMASGQVTAINPLGCIISTKYPKVDNPFEAEIGYAKKILDEVIENEKVFALLYEPDDVFNWMTNDEILEQRNPLAIEIDDIMKDLKDKREEAIEVEQKRENFITKHCNIIYTGIGTESYVSVQDLQKGRVEKIEWAGREVWLGVDLSMTNDNTSVSMVAYDNGKILCKPLCFIPTERIDEKIKKERVDYKLYINQKLCYNCGERTIDYSFVENVVLNIEKQYNVKIMGIGYDRYNCLSSAQKWQEAGYKVVEIKQHSSVLHPATKLLAEKIADGLFKYENNQLLEINFQNAKCNFDTNLNRYVNKKKSEGKVDMVVSTINAVEMMRQDVILGYDRSFGACIV